MRIAIASDWFAPRRGGIEGQLVQLAEGLGARGHRVDVLTSTPQPSSGEHFQAREIDVIRLPGVQVAVSPTLLSVLRRELQRGYDVVHAHVSVVSPIGYAAAAIARSMGIPTVLTFHSVLHGKRYLLRAVDWFANIAESGVTWTAVSQLVAKQVESALRGVRVSVLPNGIDAAFWSGEAPTRAAGRVLTLVSTMRLHRKKRPLPLLRAFAHAASRINTPARLLIAGEGSERESLEREARHLGLGDGRKRVELLGWRSRDELRSLYAQADGFVLASTRESFGIAALEARAAGLPVIAMRASGSSDFLTHDLNSLICDDDDELVRAIARFAQDTPLRARLAATPTSLQRFDWRAVLAQHETVYGLAMTRASAAAEAVATSG